MAGNVAQFVEGRGGQDFAGPQVALAAEIEVLQLVGDAFRGGNGLEDLHALGGHFRSRAIAPDYRHAQNAATHVRSCSLVK